MMEWFVCGTTVQYWHSSVGLSILPLALKSESNYSWAQLEVTTERMSHVCESQRTWISCCSFLERMPEEIVSAPSFNSFKGRFDKEYARLRHCSDIDCVST